MGAFDPLVGDVIDTTQQAGRGSLFKPGAELVAQLLKRRIHLTADLDFHQVCGTGGGGAIKTWTTPLPSSGEG
jgi:hypothetical protein